MSSSQWRDIPYTMYGNKLTALCNLFRVLLYILYFAPYWICHKWKTRVYYLLFLEKCCFRSISSFMYRFHNLDKISIFMKFFSKLKKLQRAMHISTFSLKLIFFLCKPFQWYYIDRDMLICGDGPSTLILTCSINF